MHRTGFFEDNRRPGYGRPVVTHPSDAAIANEVFSPPTETADRARRKVEALRRIGASGSAALDFLCQHTDAAHVKSAKGINALAEVIVAKVGGLA